MVEWNIGDNFETLDPPIRFSGNSQTDVTFDFDKNANPNDWWILTVIFETGEQGMYFIAEGGTAVDNGGGGDIGDPLPSNVVAYFDENDNGVYDNGEEAYSVSDLEGVSIGGTLKL
ncbi:MAG: hypothetical protein U5K70_06180 [Halodesulfurarchaeum sp.]|nr:hypothetical protein [Halodesulfurarchaeum sp.]